MRVEIVIALIMLFSFFVLEWFEGGPLVSIKGYNVVSTLTRIREAFNQSSVADSGLMIYYGLYIMPFTALYAMYLSYKDRRGHAFTVLAVGGTSVLLIMLVNAAGSNFQLLDAFGPGAWLAIITAIATYFFAADHKKKVKAETAAKAEGE